MNTYTKEIKLKHNEVAAKVNVETGEIKEVTKRPNNIPEGKEKFIADEMFAKNYTKSWNFLLDNLSAVELKIAIKMSVMAEINTNSLSPLDNNTTIRELSEFFDIGINGVKKVFKHLMDVGVYASFKYGHYQRGIVEEWIFNPYISFKGKLINSDIKELFNKTKVAKVFNSN